MDGDYIDMIEGNWRDGDIDIADGPEILRVIEVKAISDQKAEYAFDDSYAEVEDDNEAVEESVVPTPVKKTFLNIIESLSKK